MHDFTDPIYTDRHGVEFRFRQSTRDVFTYRPSTQELVYLCTEKDWPQVAARLGLKVTKTQKPTKDTTR